MTNTEQTYYVSSTETAKLLRAALKAQFPGVKFSVRTSKYAGGASIDVSWTDGPTEDQVRPVTDGYAGSRFDGMIDMAYGVTSWLEEDGTAHVAENPGTGGQRGSDPGSLGDPQGGGARMVHFCADYVFTSRQFSAALLDRLACEAPHNGRVTHPEQCVGCGHWMKDQDCWTAEADRGSRRPCPATMRPVRSSTTIVSTSPKRCTDAPIDGAWCDLAFFSAGTRSSSGTYSSQRGPRSGAAVTGPTVRRRLDCHWAICNFSDP